MNGWMPVLILIISLGVCSGCLYYACTARLAVRRAAAHLTTGIKQCRRAHTAMQRKHKLELTAVALQADIYAAQGHNLPGTRAVLSVDPHFQFAPATVPEDLIE